MVDDRQLRIEEWLLPVPRHSTRKVFVSLIALTFALVALVLVRRGTTDAGRSGAQQRAISTDHEFIIDGIEFRAPSSWKVINPTFNSGGAVEPVKYLTNGAVVAECQTHAGCGPPVAVLASGQAVVTANVTSLLDAVEPGPLPFFSVGGHTTTETLARCTQRQCLPGAEMVEIVVVNLGGTKRIVFRAEFGRDSAGARHELIGMYRSATARS